MRRTASLQAHRGGAENAEKMIYKSKRTPRALRLSGLILVLPLALAAACKKEQPEPAKPKAGEIQFETPMVNKALDAADGDPSWLSGTWQKAGEERWFLFNLPSDVAEIAGRPAHVVRRGRLVIHGRYVDAIFPTEELHFKATADRSEMQSDGIYRRGAPPP